AVMCIHLRGPVCPTPGSGGIAPTILVASMINLAFGFPVHQIGGGISSKAVVSPPTSTVHVILSRRIVINHIGIAKSYIQGVVRRVGDRLRIRNVRQCYSKKDSNNSVQIHRLFYFVVFVNLST